MKMAMSFKKATNSKKNTPHSLACIEQRVRVYFTHPLFKNIERFYANRTPSNTDGWTVEWTLYQEGVISRADLRLWSERSSKLPAMVTRIMHAAYRERVAPLRSQRSQS